MSRGGSLLACHPDEPLSCRELKPNLRLLSALLLSLVIHASLVGTAGRPAEPLSPTVQRLTVRLMQHQNAAQPPKMNAEPALTQTSAATNEPPDEQRHVDKQSTWRSEDDVAMPSLPLPDDETPAGRMVLRLLVLPTGEVLDTRIDASTLPESYAEQVALTFKSARFPARPGPN